MPEWLRTGTDVLEVLMSDMELLAHMCWVVLGLKKCVMANCLVAVWVAALSNPRSLLFVV